jgi:murein DD-endopeptidase MepM/ murein hydrolase activator NlpD
MNTFKAFKLKKDLRLAIWDGAIPILENSAGAFVVQQPIWTKQKFGNWLHGTNYGMHSAIDVYATRNGVPEKVICPVDGIVYRIYNKNADSTSETLLKAINIYSDAVVGAKGEKILFRLMHFSEIFVSNGDHVRKGQVIGLTGHTGFKSEIGDHLHIEIRLNPSCFGEEFNNNLFESIPVNPYNYLLEWWEENRKVK